jgi:hypothetical protein
VPNRVSPEIEPRTLDFPRCFRHTHVCHIAWTLVGTVAVRQGNVKDYRLRLRQGRVWFDRKPRTCSSTIVLFSHPCVVLAEGRLPLHFVARPRCRVHEVTPHDVPGRQLPMITGKCLEMDGPPPHPNAKTQRNCHDGNNDH